MYLLRSTRTVEVIETRRTDVGTQQTATDVVGRIMVVVIPSD